MIEILFLVIKLAHTCLTLKISASIAVVKCCSVITKSAEITFQTILHDDMHTPYTRTLFIRTLFTTNIRGVFERDSPLKSNN